MRRVPDAASLTHAELIEMRGAMHPNYVVLGKLGRF